MSIQRAVVSTNTHLDYAFYAPFVCHLWRRAGWLPMLILVGTPEQWLGDRRLHLVLERSRAAGAECHFVDVAGASTATVAQCARLFAAGLPGVRSDDYILTSDVDMLPLGPWVGGGVDDARPGPRNDRYDLHLWFANAYSGGPCPHDSGRTNPCPHFPICYIGARARVWREIVHAGFSDSPPPPDGFWGKWLIELTTVLDNCPKDPTLAWNYDETWLGKHIRAWPGFPDHAQLINRDFRKGEWRLDRSDWRVGDAAWRAEHMKSLDGVADAHLPRPGWWNEEWPTIRPLLELALSPKMLAWADSYRREFAEAK